MHVSKVIGYQQFSSTTITSAQRIATTALIDQASGDRANAAWISIGGSTGAVRFRDDGTAPTGALGMRLVPGLLPYLYQGDLMRLQFILDATTGNADVNLSYVQVSD